MRGHMPEALPDILDYLLSKGYKIVPISRIFLTGAETYRATMPSDWLTSRTQNRKRFRPTSGEYSRSTLPSMMRRINSPVRLIFASLRWPA